MIDKVKKTTLQDLIKSNWDAKDSIEKFLTKSDITYTPVRLNTFLKREDDYLFITHIAPFDKAPYMVDGYSVSVEQYRHYMICEILGTDFRIT